MPKLIRDLKQFYRTGKRDLPWRHTRDPYKILVSEIMLQQTQVERVIPFYERFIKRFPTPEKLANARLGEVLKLWQGLGYNRRAAYLWRSAEVLRSGEMNRSPAPARRTSASPHAELLRSLPGVGPYTARAVAAFAYNRPEIFIETNIRTVFIHHCFKKYDISYSSKKIDDSQILPLVAQALKESKMQPRDFYAALMDYGAHLKRQGVRLNSKSTHYAKQSKFEGSRRQKRAARLRALLARGASQKELEKVLHS